ncbi:MAG: helix-turn-helix domain-containing protein [Clostridiales bacterium]|nr:helix-turn-helix domain-containing protein [Clostridiales bacterium]
MAVFRVEKNANYTTMSNHHLKDHGLSLKAKGLLSQFLSLPDSWHYNVKGLVTINKDGKAAIETALWELEQCGYVQRRQLRDENGRMSGVEYIIYEVPQTPEPETALPLPENPSTGNPAADKPQAENPPQLNTNPSNTDRIKYREEKEPRRQYGAYGNVLFTDSEYEKLRAEFPSDYQQRIERLSEYMASTGKHYKNHLATLRSWARRDGKKPVSGYSHSNYAFEEGDSL